MYLYMKPARSEKITVVVRSTLDAAENEPSTKHPCPLARAHLRMRPSVYPLRRKEQQLAATVECVRPESRPSRRLDRSHHLVHPPLPSRRRRRRNTAGRERADQLLRVPSHGLRLQAAYRGGQGLRGHFPGEVPAVPEERGVERLDGGHVLRQRPGDELQQEAEAAQDAAADLRGDVRCRDEGDEDGRHPLEVREEGALEVTSENRDELEDFLAGLEG